MRSTLAGHTPAVPELPAPLHAPIPPGHTYREIRYEEAAGVGYLHFDFYNGAMSTDQCRRLREAYRHARSRRTTKVIVLMGGADFWSNGIHLNVIEAAADPAAESWYNLHAIDDVVRDVIETDSHLVVAALSGDAAAGGVPLALAADHVVAREDIVLNPYYRHMGGLYGSEYWTYLLPRRVGAATTSRLTSAPFEAIGTREAVEIGLLDAAFGATADAFRTRVRRDAERLARDAGLGRRLEDKRRARAWDEGSKPLRTYRIEELSRSHECFLGPTPAITRPGAGSCTSSARRAPSGTRPDPDRRQPPAGAACARRRRQDNASRCRLPSRDRCGTRARCRRRAGAGRPAPSAAHRALLRGPTRCAVDRIVTIAYG